MRTCANCGAKLSVTGPEGLCPRCFLQEGLTPVADAAAEVAPREPAEGEPSASTPPPGSSRPVLGDYELLHEIACGGMGMVYKARQISLHRTVAVKMIRAAQLANEGAVKRFHTEAEATASLDHPNIVSIYEVGQHAGQPFFSMRYVDGPNLSKYVADLPTRLSPQEAARLLVTVARAVHYAHQHGILHRDLKPANILMDAHGQPHVTDFGLAKLIEGSGDLTLSGVALGTPNYMSPEQAAGTGRKLTTATDVFSLGAVLYFLLTGRPPFEGATPLEVMRKVVETEPVRPSKVGRRNGVKADQAAGERGAASDAPIEALSVQRIDQDLETICLKCLEKVPARRYASADALANDLEHWLRHEPVRARSAGRLYHFRKSVRRNPLAYGAAAAVVGALALGVAFSSWQAARALRAEKLAEERLVESEKARAAAEASEARAIAAERETKAKADAERALDRAQEMTKYLTAELFGDSNRAPFRETQLTAWLTALRQAVATNPTAKDMAIRLATIDLWLGETNEHRTLCRELLAWAAEHSEDPAPHQRAAYAYLLQSHPDPEMLKQAVAAARKALKLTSPNFIHRGWMLVVAGLAAIRDGLPGEAEPPLTEALSAPRVSRNLRGLGLACRTIARAQLGRTNEAQADFAELDRIRPAFPAPPTPSAILFLLDEMAVAQMYEEAKALLNEPGVTHASMRATNSPGPPTPPAD